LSQASAVLRSALVSVLFIAWAGPLGAQPAEEAVRFQYTAPPSCPDGAAFTARVRARTSRGRLAEPTELARSFRLDVAADTEGFVGRIEFLDDSGVTVNRQLHGEQCDAVVSSLALITALALDATLREEEAPPPSPTVAEEPRTPTPALPPAQVKTTPPTQAAPVRDSKLRHARIGIGGAQTTALPGGQRGSWSSEIALLGQLEWRSALSLRLRAHLNTTQFAVDDGRRASLRILGVETSLCPWHLSWGQAGLDPCATVDFGSLRAAGELGDKLTTAGNKTIGWASVGAELRLTVDSSTLPVWVELGGSAAFPLVATYKFRFQKPTALVYEVPGFAAAARFAFGVRFW